VEVVKLDLPDGGIPLEAGEEISINWTMFETVKAIM